MIERCRQRNKQTTTKHNSLRASTTMEHTERTNSKKELCKYERIENNKQHHEQHAHDYGNRAKHPQMPNERTLRNKQ